MEYQNATREVIKEQPNLSPKDFAEAFRGAFYNVHSHERKVTHHAAAIADPNLGDEWWRLVVSLNKYDILLVA